MRTQIRNVMIVDGSGAKPFPGNILLEDELFSSPSYAAMFVIGKSENGLTRWKTADGKSLKSLEAEQETD